MKHLAAILLSALFLAASPFPPMFWDRVADADMDRYLVYYASVVATPYDCLCCEESDPDTFECLTVVTCTCYDYMGPWDTTIPTPWMLGATEPQVASGPVTTSWDSGDPGPMSLFVFKICSVDQAGNADIECPVNGGVAWNLTPNENERSNELIERYENLSRGEADSLRSLWAISATGRSTEGEIIPEGQGE